MASLPGPGEEGRGAIPHLSVNSITSDVQQGMVDGSASRPALRQDTGFMVEKTYLDIAPYLGALGACLMPQ